MKLVRKCDHHMHKAFHPMLIFQSVKSPAKLFDEYGCEPVSCALCFLWTVAEEWSELQVGMSMHSNHSQDVSLIRVQNCEFCTKIGVLK